MENGIPQNNEIATEQWVICRNTPTSPVDSKASHTAVRVRTYLYLPETSDNNVAVYESRDPDQATRFASFHAAKMVTKDCGWNRDTMVIRLDAARARFKSCVDALSTLSDKITSTTFSYVTPQAIFKQAVADGLIHNINFLLKNYFGDLSQELVNPDVHARITTHRTEALWKACRGTASSGHILETCNWRYSIGGPDAPYVGSNYNGSPVVLGVHMLTDDHDKLSKLTRSYDAQMHRKASLFSEVLAATQRERNNGWCILNTIKAIRNNRPNYWQNQPLFHPNNKAVHSYRYETTRKMSHIGHVQFSGIPVNISNVYKKYGRTGIHTYIADSPHYTGLVVRGQLLPSGFHHRRSSYPEKYRFLAGQYSQQSVAEARMESVVTFLLGFSHIYAYHEAVIENSDKELSSRVVEVTENGVPEDLVVEDLDVLQEIGDSLVECIDMEEVNHNELNPMFHDTAIKLI